MVQLIESLAALLVLCILALYHAKLEILNLTRFGVGYFSWHYEDVGITIASHAVGPFFSRRACPGNGRFFIHYPSNPW